MRTNTNLEMEMEMEMEMVFNGYSLTGFYHREKADFHMKDCAPRFDLKTRVKATFSANPSFSFQSFFVSVCFVLFSVLFFLWGRRGGGGLNGP